MAERTTNLAGLKVSESPYDKVAPYLALGLRTYVGSEPLLPQALADGAYGSVSGLASAFPADVRRVLDEPTPEHAQHLASLRDTLGATTFIAGLKWVLRNHGVPIQPDVRAPLAAGQRRARRAARDALTASGTIRSQL